MTQLQTSHANQQQLSHEQIRKMCAESMFVPATEHDPFERFGDLMSEFGTPGQQFQPAPDNQAYAKPAAAKVEQKAPTPLDSEQQLEQDLLRAQQGDPTANQRVEESRGKIGPGLACR